MSKDHAFVSAPPRRGELASAETGAASLTVQVWRDPRVDAIGHDPRSRYVERYWLGVLGPSSVWLLRRLIDGLDDEPDGYTTELADLSRALGLGAGQGKQSAIRRSLVRLVQFRAARERDDDVFEIRRRLPPLAPHQVERLPPSLQRSHDAHRASLDANPIDVGRIERARRVASSLIEAGEDHGATERALAALECDPATASQAVDWAWAQRRPISA